MERFRSWTAGLISRVDWMVSQVENHEALAQSAIRDVRRAAARARVQLARVRADGERQRRERAEQHEAEHTWRERARAAAEQDETRALECLRRARRAQRRAAELERRVEEHERFEKQLAHDVATVEERLGVLETQRNLLRTRQSRAEALSTVRDGAPVGDVDGLFERWETRVLEREFEGGCAAGADGLGDAFEDEFEEAEEEQALREELDALRS
ncbi:MAG: PspA/IM30 family protein [Myxococcota bacterium]|nr:PspA/IM30 family protein [Myxococcota bacterium]